MKLEDVKVPHTLGWSSYILLKFLYIDSTEEVVNLYEVEVQKRRNLSVHESEESDHGEGVGVMSRLTANIPTKIVSDQKTLIFFCDFLFLSGKLGKQSLRLRGTINFFFGITVFLDED